MTQEPWEKHDQDVPSIRKIRRSCNKELYRTIKRLKLWVPQEKLEAAQKLYFERVLSNLPFVVENNRNRKKLCDWWDQDVCPDIAKLWDVDEGRLSTAFRQAFGG